MTVKLQKSSAPKIVLCIDDEPDRPIPGRKPTAILEDLLNDYFDKSGYLLKFASTFRDVEESLFPPEKQHKLNRDIGLVLLDYNLDFTAPGGKGTWQGPQVADWLYAQNPDIKFIGLTRRTSRGTKIQFGHRENKVDFVVKKDLDKNYLLNIAHSIIDDYANQGWEVVWDPASAHLILSKGGYKLDTNIPNKKVGGWRCGDVLTAALRTPLKWVGPFPGRLVNVAVNEINADVKEKSAGRIWGLLTTEGAPAKCVKALVKAAPGGVSVAYTPPPLQGQVPIGGGNWAQNVDAQIKDMQKRIADLEKKCGAKGSGSKSVSKDAKNEAKTAAAMGEEAAIETNMKKVRRSLK